MVIRIEPHRFGYLVIAPVNKRERNRTSRYLAGWGVESDGSVLVNQIEDLPIDLSRSEVRDLEEGWALRKRLDPWTWGQLVGWDYSR